MTDHDNDLAELDRVTEAIRSDRLDDAAVAAATERVWQRISTGLEHPIAGCADYQLLIPELVAGHLSPARALLVEDHTRECVPCRRALLAHRTGVATSAVAPTRAARRGVPRWARPTRAACRATSAACRPGSCRGRHWNIHLHYDIHFAPRTIFHPYG